MNIISSSNANQYRDPAPYPTIQVSAQNLCYANILLQDYASSASELTAITQYLYHNLMQSKYPEVAEMMLGIAEVEMEHLHMLGETIVLLGGKPIFAANCPRDYWDGSDVTYGRSISDQLRDDLNAELGAIKQYNRHIMQIGDPYVRQILARIALDEEWHVSLLNYLIAKYGSPGPCPVDIC